MISKVKVGLHVLMTFGDHRLYNSKFGRKYKLKAKGYVVHEEPEVDCKSDCSPCLKEGLLLTLYG